VKNTGEDKKADTDKRNELLEDFEEHLFKLEGMKKQNQKEMK
jgi:Tfp pilus assembly protein PilP